jgi:MoaA/NifB/PqqE/SkfB family radical SAM enzyme
MFAHTCNIACRHCGILSSPDNHNRMELSFAQGLVQQASEHPLIEQINFTGGEPFLFPDAHLKLISQAKAAGLQTRAVTNGFWARRVDRGLKFLRQFRDAGLDELNFSADKWHLEFMPPEVLRNALRVASELGYRRIVSFVTNEPDEPFDQLAALYGLDRSEMIDVRPLRTRAKLDEAGDKLFIYAGALIGMGRAAQYPDEHLLTSIEMFEPGRGCLEVINKPVVYPDGTLQACCCAGGRVASFEVGNLHQRSLAELVEEMMGRPHYQMINDFGPRTLFDAVTRELPERPLKAKYSSICELCVDCVHDLPRGEIDRIVQKHYLEHMLSNLGLDGANRAALAPTAETAVGV